MNFSNIAFIDCYLSDMFIMLRCIKAIRVSNACASFAHFPCSVVWGVKITPTFYGIKITPVTEVQKLPLQK